jgi:ribosome-binding factor A
MAVLHAGVPKIRYELGRRVRNQLRIVPEIAFFLDDSNDYIDNITNLLKE